MIADRYFLPDMITAIQQKDGWKRSETTEEPNYMKGVHAKQRAFIEDQSRRKAILGGRRGGKSEGAFRWACLDWEKHPEMRVPIVAITKGHAKRIYGPIIARMKRLFEMPYKYNELTGDVTFPNGYTIWLVGADKDTEVEKMRGPAYAKAIIDEPGSFPDHRLRYLCEDILDPALMDVMGPLALVGTPGLNPAGYYYERTTGDGKLSKWSTHHFTCLDNPYVKGHEYLEEKRKDNEWDEQNPTYIREYMGAWILDKASKVYQWDRDKNAFQRLPSGLAWRDCVAVDIGWDDNTAFSYGCASKSLPDIFVKRCWRLSNPTVPRIAAELMKLKANSAQLRIVMDTAGGAKVIAETLRREYSLPVMPAFKPEKLNRIHDARSRLQAGTLKFNLQGCRDLTDEADILPWNEKRDDHHEDFLDDCWDATLYLIRELIHQYKPEEQFSQQELEQREIVERREQDILEAKRNYEEKLGTGKRRRKRSRPGRNR